MMRPALLSELGSSSPDLDVLRQCAREPLQLSHSERLELWSWLLLGVRTVEGDFPATCDWDDVEEVRVLEADVRRTRQEEPTFRREATRTALRNLLARFCEGRRTPYRQGLNELAAPFVYLEPNSKLAFALFDKFVQRFAEKLYGGGGGSRGASATASPSSSSASPGGSSPSSLSKTPNKSSLLCACRLFGSFVGYHDPRLTTHLADAGFSPALYATPWLLTLMARNVGDIEETLALYDTLLAYDDPAFVFGLGFATLRSRRDVLLKMPANKVPELLAKQLSGGSYRNDKGKHSTHFSALTPAADAALRQTPPSFRRALTSSLSGGGGGGEDPTRDEEDGGKNVSSSSEKDESNPVLDALSERTAMPSFSARNHPDSSSSEAAAATTTAGNFSFFLGGRRRPPWTTPRSRPRSLIGLSRLERAFWLPAILVRAEEVVDALSWSRSSSSSSSSVIATRTTTTGQGGSRRDGLASSWWHAGVVVVDASPPGEASRLAAGRLADSVWPTMEYLAFGSSDDGRREAFLANWARSRVTSDPSLRGKHVVVIGAGEGPRRRRRDTIAEALLPRDLLRKGASLIHAIKEKQRTTFGGGADDEDDVDEDWRGDGGGVDVDDDDPGDVVGADHSLLTEDAALTDAVAEVVAGVLQEAGVPRVSVLERGGFERVVEVARSRGPEVLRACLPHFDEDHWSLYLAELRQLAQRKRAAADHRHGHEAQDPPPEECEQQGIVALATRVFDAVRRPSAEPRWGSWIDRGCADGGKDDDDEQPRLPPPPPRTPPPSRRRGRPRSDRSQDDSDIPTPPRSSPWSVVKLGDTLLDDATFDESYF